MTAEQIQDGLRSLDAQHPFYLAVLALLDGDIVEEQYGAIAPNLADGQRQFAAGRLAHAMDIRRAVEGCVAEARNVKREPRQD